MNCLQYYYENPDDSIKYEIPCKNRVFNNLNNVNKFNNKELLEYISETYGKEAFPNAEASPLEFKESYSELSNEDICKKTDMNLAPQQKFMGQVLGQDSNFNNMLIYHGLGSGKSCTSIVIGEALKKSSNQRLLYVVPAPLVDQYFEEIIGDIRNGKFFSCPSFCLIKKDGKNLTRDFYVSQQENSILEAKTKQLEIARTKLFDIQIKLNEDPDNNRFQLDYKNQETTLGRLKRDYLTYQNLIKGKVIKTFDIVSHQTFIGSLYKTGTNGEFIKDKGLERESALFHKNGLLVIDEIQRLISAGGTFYKKLYNAIKFYFHPELKLILMSATPIYDNPFELALTINLLRPRVPFPINKTDFYKFFIGKFDENGNCIKSSDDWVSKDSCILNEELISYICSGYVSYFKGGNPNAYPYKRIITMQHLFSPSHKSAYIQALKSDVSKDTKKIKSSTKFNSYENVLLGNYETENEDNVNGIYVTTQQYSNIFLPGEPLSVAQKKNALQLFRSDLNSKNFQDTNEIISYVKTFSTKMASIVELTLSSDGPVFIFSNWLTFGVEPISIILQKCGLVSFEKENRGFGKFFIWSSETKNKDKDGMFIKKARNTFNSIDNKDGSLLKVILGTRSVMEGVSFKNVKQVHITEPWWNESRIEQILARASRYCSHSNLPIEEQYVDIYRHYSIVSLDGEPDAEITSMLKEVRGGTGYEDYDVLGIDEMMLNSSLKKFDLNLDLNNILKKCAIDSNINRHGNLIRLEENIIPLRNGMYQVFYKNPSNDRKYLREGVPKEISFGEIYSRKYSYPNIKTIKFTESRQVDTGYFEPYDDAEILDSNNINEDIIINENIKPWDSNKTFEDLELDNEIKAYMTNLYKNHSLFPILRKNYLNEKGTNVITHKDDIKKRLKLIGCIKQLAIENIVTPDVKKQIAKEFTKESKKQKMSSMVLDLIYKHKIYPESYLEELLNISVMEPDIIFEIMKSISNK